MMRDKKFASAQVLSFATSFAVASAIAFGLASKALAYDDPSGWIGGQGGMSVPSEPGTTARPTLGIQAGAKIGSEFGLGVYYTSAVQNETINSVSQSYGYNLYGVMAGYYFEGDARGAFFGVRGGLSKVTQTFQGTSLNFAPYHIGVVGGYDYLLFDHLSIGGEVSYTSVGQASGNVNNTNVNNDPFSILDFVGTLKFWF